MGRVNLQSFLVGVIVGAAALYVGRLLWRSAKGEGDAYCEKCEELKTPPKGKRR